MLRAAQLQAADLVLGVRERLRQLTTLQWRTALFVGTIYALVLLLVVVLGADKIFHGTCAHAAGADQQRSHAWPRGLRSRHWEFRSYSCC